MKLKCETCIHLHVRPEPELISNFSLNQDFVIIEECSKFNNAPMNVRTRVNCIRAGNFYEEGPVKVHWIIQGAAVANSNAIAKIKLIDGEESSES